jgi:hypothetical protein
MSTTPAPIDPPDPEKVTSLIEALDKFIVSMTPVPGQPEPAGAVVLEAIGRLEGLLQEFGEVERWEDTTKLTGTSVVAGGIKGARDVLATRLYAPQVSPRERGWLTEHLQDLRRGMEAIGRLGPFGSMDPMHNPSPVLTPDPNLLLAILTDASKWYQWAALRDGQNPRDDDRLSVLNASCQLSDTIARFGNDPRWQTDNRYHRIYFVVNRLALLVLEATRRSYLVRTDDGWILDPPKQDYTKGMDEFDYGNPFLSPEIASEVDLARQDIQQAMLELINLNTSNRQVEPAHSIATQPSGNAAPVVQSGAKAVPEVAGGDEPAGAREPKSVGWKDRVSIEQAERRIYIDGKKWHFNHDDIFKFAVLLADKEGDLVLTDEWKPLFPNGDRIHEKLRNNYKEYQDKYIRSKKGQNGGYRMVLPDQNGVD